MKRTIKLLAVLLITAPILFSCQNKKDTLKVDYQTVTLDNGLTVVLNQDHSDPIVAVAIQYHAGSGREKVGKTGFAHFFEHMLFQRSENLPRNAFFQKIADMGGDFNGGTWQDGTIYYETVPRDAIEKVLWMESDRMGYFINTVSQAGLDREVDIILNEKRQTADNTAYGQMEAIYAKEMYPKGHPYSWAIIGDMDDIRSATIDDVKEFYATYYIPRNATIAISGDFDATQVIELVKKYFGEIPSGTAIDDPVIQPAKLDRTKKVVYEDPFAPLPMIQISYPAVDMCSNDDAPLSMLAYLLAGTKDSPMYKTIVEANLAPDVRAGSNSSEVAGTFDITISAYDGISLDTIYAAIQKAYGMFETAGVDQMQMQMSKAMKEKSSYNQLSSVMGKAMSLAMSNEFQGKPDAFVDDLAKYKAITAEDVMRVYNQYIKGHDYLAISMVPKGKAELALSGSTVAEVAVENVEDASSQQTKSKAGAIVDDDYPRTPSSFDRSVEPAYLSNTPATTIPTIWGKTLSNGMQLSGITHNEIPVITFDIVMKGGLLLDPADKPGVSYLNAALMNEGTKLHSTEEMEQMLNLLGASVHVYSSANTMGISGNCLSRNFTEVMKIVEEIITEPLFDEDALEMERNKAMARIQQDAKRPAVLANNAIKKLLFGDNSVLAKSYYGNEESLKNINIDDIKAFYTNKFSPKLASFNIAGAITEAECEKALTSLLSNWIGYSKVTVNNPLPEPTAKKGVTYFIDYPGAKQSVIMAGGKGLPYSDPKYYSLDVLNYKLGSGSNGELFNVLRLQRGYTYGAYSGFVPKNGYGTFAANSSVQATVTKESLDIFKEIFKHYGKNYTQEMLDETKNAIIRSNAFAFETQWSLVGMLDNIYTYNLPKDYVKVEESVVNNMTLDDVKKLADEFLNDDELTYVIVGDAKTQFKKIKGAVKMK